MYEPQPLPELTQAEPFQYCPEGHCPVVGEFTKAIPFQYCPVGQEVLLVFPPQAPFAQPQPEMARQEDWVVRLPQPEITVGVAPRTPWHSAEL